MLVSGDALSEPTVGGFIKGGVADWLVANEAIRGTDVYAPIDELADKWLGLQNVSPSTPHPRPPSAIAVLLPLAGAPAEDVMVVIALVMAIFFVLFVERVLLWAGLSVSATWFVVLLLGSSVAINQGALWGTHIPLVAFCCGVLVFPTRRSSAALGGLLAGISVGLKLFPALLVGSIAKEIPKRVGLAALCFMFLTLVGLLLPGVGFGAFAAIGGAPSAYGDSTVDMSLAAQLGISGQPIALLIPLIAISLLPLLWKLDDLRLRISLTAIVMLVSVPIAWPEYQLLALPAAVVLWTRSIIGRIAAIGWVTVLVVSLDGRVHFAALLTLALALMYEVLRRPSRPSLTV
jgi:hypothetical protein